MKRFFTMLELLIVISIIAILAAILLPALQSATREAYSVFCKNNLKQIMLMNTQYHMDFDNWQIHGDYIQIRLSELYGGKKIWICLQKTTPIELNYDGVKLKTCYTYSEYTLGPLDSIPMYKVMQFRAPSKSIIFHDGNGPWRYVYPHTTSSDRPAPDEALDPATGKPYYAAFRHKKRCQAGIIDGHVACAKAEYVSNFLSYVMPLNNKINPLFE